MRKSLSYKILAALMAAGSFGLYAATSAAADVQLDVQLKDDQLRANGNAIIINGDKLTSPVMADISDLSSVSEVYGIGSTALSADTDYYTGNADGGNVEINSSTFGRVYGGYTDGSNNTATANNNTVTLNGSNIDYVYGGHSGHRSANVNTVIITGGNYDAVVGGQSGNNADSNVVSISNAAINRFIIGGEGGTANSNKVEIKNSTVTENSGISGWALTGGYASSGSASSNQIIITDSTISGNVYGAYIYDNNGQLAENNSITITGSSNIENANLYGYGTNSGATGSNNTLTLNGWSGTVNSLHNFDSIIFENIDLSQKEITLNVTDTASNLKDVSINIDSVKTDSLTAGDYAQDSTVTITTIKWDEDLGNNVTVSSNFNSSLAQINTNAYYFAKRENSDGIYVNQFSNLQGTDSNDNDNQAEITANVTK